MPKAYPKEVVSIGDAIRKRRLDLGLTQNEAAARIGCDEMSVVNWELGHRTPRVGHLQQIVEFLAYDPFPTGSMIGERLVNFRKARGITQKHFAGQLGIDQGTLARYERGERQPTGDYLARIERKLLSKSARPFSSLNHTPSVKAVKS